MPCGNFRRGTACSCTRLASASRRLFLNILAQTQRTVATEFAGLTPSCCAMLNHCWREAWEFQDAARTVWHCIQNTRMYKYMNTAMDHRYIHPSIHPPSHPSIHPSIHPSVHPSIRPSTFFRTQRTGSRLASKAEQLAPAPLWVRTFCAPLSCTATYGCVHC